MSAFSICFRVISRLPQNDLEMMKFAVNRYNLLNSDVLTSYKDLYQKQITFYQRDESKTKS